MNENCLLIKTKDNRCFITHEKNFGSIIEFAKVFNAEIYLVQKLCKEKPLSLEALTAAMCNSDYKIKPKHTKIARLFPAPKRPRQSILKNATQIRRYIKKRLLSGKPVSLKDLKNKYKDQDYTDACLCNHLSSIRKDLTRDGHVFLKVGAGKYCLTVS